MWVVGGWGAGAKMISSVESYNIATDTWTKRPSLPVGLAACSLAVLPTSKGLSLATLGGYYHMDEKWKYPTDTCFRYDREMRCWAYESTLRLPKARCGHAMVTV
mmetsp:Transcript_38659/g.96843  ORF Transcript_38659/g.96843 Transcript_38659/m.96843 type:complete len:104 (+) Transcript_38659:2-313(+)